MWTVTELAAFARNGYLVTPGVVAEGLRVQALSRIADLLATEPVPQDHTGHHFLFRPTGVEPELTALLTDSGALDLARALTAPRTIAVPPLVQVALTFPPHSHQPGGGHLDGFSVTEVDGRPGTFTLLVGVVLSDQTRPGTGNLVVWPGSHRACAAAIRQHGVEPLLASGGHPDVPHDNPAPVCAAPGGVIFSSYLLSHNTGPDTSTAIRKTVYFRLKVDGHGADWHTAITDELHEFAPARHAADAGPQPLPA